MKVYFIVAPHSLTNPSDKHQVVEFDDWFCNPNSYEHTDYDTIRQAQAAVAKANTSERAELEELQDEVAKADELYADLLAAEAYRAEH